MNKYFLKSIAELKNSIYICSEINTFIINRIKQIIMNNPTFHTLTNPVEEARRYVNNAKEILTERGDLDYETQYYRDRR